MIDAVGILTLVIGLAAFLAGPGLALRALVLSTVFGAAAALTFGNGSSIQPAYLLLIVCLLVMLQRDRTRPLLVGAVAFRQPGFWFLATALYGACSAVILPRLFEGQAYVYAVVRTEGTLGLALRPLAPVSGNLTQPVYLFGDVVAFAIGAACAATPRRLRIVTDALLACAAANLLLGAIDLAAFKLGLGDVLGIVRNANYRMLQDGEVVGFKRIVGAFPEASAYAYMTLGLCIVSLRLWISGIRPAVSGPLAALSAVTIVLTTSSSGYAGLLAGLGLTYAHCLSRALRGRGGRTVVKVLILIPVLGTLGLFALALAPPLQEAVMQLGEATIFNKMATQSGIERSLWNSQALSVFFATSGLGAGVGSVRASSFLIAVLANVGVIGTALYAMFLLSVLREGGLPRSDPYRRAVQGAARAACLALLVSACVSGGSVDLGLVFSLLAGLGSSRLLASRHAAPVAGRASRRPAPPAVAQAGGGPAPCPA